MVSSETTPDENRKFLKSLWRPHVGQRTVMQSPARFRIVAAGRRWGKSAMCAHIALETALETPGSVVWWVSPSYEQSNSYGFDKMKPLLSPDVLAESPKLSKPREIVLDNGSSVSFRSADREDSLRGGGIDLLILDEAGSVPKRAYTAELRPALSDTLGDMVAIGTPRGRTWFWRWYQRGQSGDYPDVASWQARSAQNPHLPATEIDAAKGDMPERVFRQEYLAEFVDESGGVFQNIRARNVADYPLPVAPEDSAGPYAIGVDFARMSDWTVVVVLDAAKRVVAFERLRETTWTRIQTVVERLASEYAPNRVALDATRDNKIVQDLSESIGNGSVEPVSFSASRKRTLIENLITALETGEITLSADANQLINELEVFEYETSDSGTVSYDAPSGFHDDAVDALSLAVEVANNNSKQSARKSWIDAAKSGESFSWNTGGGPRNQTPNSSGGRSRSKAEDYRKRREEYRRQHDLDRMFGR